MTTQFAYAGPYIYFESGLVAGLRHGWLHRNLWNRRPL